MSVKEISGTAMRGRSPFPAGEFAGDIGTVEDAASRDGTMNFLSFPLEAIEVIEADADPGKRPHFVKIATDIEVTGKRGRKEVLLTADIDPEDEDIGAADALRVLRVPPRFLRPTGFVVASIPNVAHGSLRLSLLGGEFRYRNLGLLDDTHLRFFTRETIEKMFLEAGFVISEMQRATVGILDSELNVRELGFPEEILEWVSKEPEVLTYQFVLKAALASKTKLTSTLNARVLDLTREVDELQRLLRQYQKKEAIHVELEARASDLEDKLASAQEHVAHRDNLLRVAQEHVAHRDNLLRVAQEQVAHRGNLLTQVSDQLRVRETEIAEHLRRSENLQGELGVFPVRMLRALLRLFKRKEERTS